VDDPGAIREAGWRQGSVVEFAQANSRFRELLSEQGSRFTHWIVVSQDCDVVHRSYSLEPDVELLGCNLVEKADGNLTAGKNPRRLHAAITVKGKQRIFDARVCDRFCIPRSVLETMRPSADATLDKPAVDVVAEWISRRYVRSAFPDAFNERLRQKRKGFKKVLEDHGEVLEGIYFSLSTFDELSPDKAYRLKVRLVMFAEDYKDADRLDRALRAKDAFEIGLEHCEGIKLVSVEVISADKFTLADMADFPAWDGFDYLSNVEGQELEDSP
jgi:hypothetical protein